MSGVDGALANVAATVEQRIAEVESGAAIVVERAAEAIDAAQERAEEIARAAMETELGRRIATLETERETWRQEREGLRQDLSAATADLSTLRTQLAAVGVLTATALARTHSAAPSLSTPPTSEAETTGALETVQELLPETLDLPAPPAVPVAPIGREPRHRLI